MNTSKSKGTSWETAIVNYLNAAALNARRLPPAGNVDVGDIAVDDAPWLTIEAKNARIYSFPEWIREANTEADNAGVPTGIVWAHRNGKGSPADGFVVMDGDTFRELLIRFVRLGDIPERQLAGRRRPLARPAVGDTEFRRDIREASDALDDTSDRANSYLRDDR